jgi:hypothetical protein
MAHARRLQVQQQGDLLQQVPRCLVSEVPTQSAGRADCETVRTDSAADGQEIQSRSYGPRDYARPRSSVGRNRPTVGDSSAGQESQRRIVASTSERICESSFPTANALDQLIFRIDSRRCSTVSHQAVCREAEERMIKTFKYRLLPTRKQTAALEQTLYLCRHLYNCALEQRRMHRTNQFAQMRELTEVRAELFPKVRLSSRSPSSGTARTGTHAWPWSVL